MAISDILRLSGGAINKINDTIIGGVPQGNSTTASATSGQLGKELELDDSNLIYDTTMGTVFGGRFRYVRLAAAALAVVVGQIVFWDISVADNLFQVTTSEAGSVPGAQWRAGIVLNSGWTAGNYGIIQTWGPTYVKFRSALSHVPTGLGVAVYCAAVGAGANNGFADTIDSADPANFSDVNLMANRYLGAAIDLPTNGGLKLINLNIANRRG